MSDHKPVPTIPELLPCPFCGGTSAFVERKDFSSAYVQCDSMVDEHSCCMARGPIASQDDDGEEIPGAAAAIAAWNKRAAPAVRVEPVAHLSDLADEIPARNTFGGQQRFTVAEQQPFEWPLLDAPALIGGVVVGKGCSSGHVVMIAKRKYQYEAEHSPEEHARRQKAFQDALAQIREGIVQQPASHPDEDYTPEERGRPELEPAPDVAGLVEALEAARAMWGDYLPPGNSKAMVAMKLVDAALATHRKGGDA